MIIHKSVKRLPCRDDPMACTCCFWYPGILTSLAQSVLWKWVMEEFICLQRLHAIHRKLEPGLGAHTVSDRDI